MLSITTNLGDIDINLYALATEMLILNTFLVRVLHMKWRNYWPILLVDTSNKKWNNKLFILWHRCSLFMVVLLQLVSSHRFRKSISWRSAFVPHYVIQQQRSLDMSGVRKERPTEKMNYLIFCYPRALWLKEWLTDSTDTTLICGFKHGLLYMLPRSYV